MGNRKDTKEIYDYLMQVREKDRVIYRKEIQRAGLKSCLTRSAALQPNPDRVKASQDNRLEEIEAKVDELDREIDSLREEKALRIMEVTDLIESLEDENEKTVLTAFFIGSDTMQDAADAICYSVKHAYRIRKRGLIKLQEKREARENGNF